MGSVAKSTATSINNATTSKPQDVQILVEGYLRRKIKQHPPLRSDDVSAQSHRVSTKLDRLLPKLSQQATDIARTTGTQLMLRLPREIQDVRQSRGAPLSDWGSAMLSNIDASFHEQAVRNYTEAFLFSHIDVHQSVRANIIAIKSHGLRLKNATVPHKAFVQRVIDRYSSPAYMTTLHAAKCKNEYGKRAKQCARDINNTTSTRVARVALESYFWEKLYRGGNTASANRTHLAIKLDHLLATLTNHRDLATQVFREVTDPTRLGHDLAWKAHVDNLDLCIEDVAEDEEASPPETAGNQVFVNLPVMSNNMALVACMVAVGI